MLRVYFTVDVETWCNNWNNIDNDFFEAFQRYIHGKTNKGNFGLSYTLQTLNDHGLSSVFFVEPLFSLSAGTQYLREIVETIQHAQQSVELHIHTEWLDAAKKPLFVNIKEKRQHLKHFSLNEQKKIIKLGKKLLYDVGVEQINAFRAGSFGFNLNTLRALKYNDIYIDSSYNATCMGLESGLSPNKILTDSLFYNDVYELPMTVYTDRPNHLRHAQLCACSSRELEGLLWQALKEGKQEFVILSHSAELLDRSRSKPNHIVIKRFSKLCEFLAKNKDSFITSDFDNFSYPHAQRPLSVEPLSSPIWRTGLRNIEQALSRFY